MKPRDFFVWVDLETTGLIPNSDSILELGIIITDGKFEELKARSWVFPLPPDLRIADIDPAVLAMHSNNGLFAECMKSRFCGDTIERAAVNFVCTDAPAYTKDIGPICGASVHFDKRFIDFSLPKLGALFNHRVFDTSSLKQLWCQVNGPSPDEGVKPKHRALDDIRDSIGWAKKVRSPKVLAK